MKAVGRMKSKRNTCSAAPPRGGGNVKQSIPLQGGVGGQRGTCQEGVYRGKLGQHPVEHAHLEYLATADKRIPGFEVLLAGVEGEKERAGGPCALHSATRVIRRWGRRGHVAQLDCVGEQEGHKSATHTDLYVPGH